MTASDLSRLADPFDPSDIEWKPGATTRDKTKGLAMAYLSSRSVQQRFDEVCGPADWRNEFQAGPDGGVLCGISVRVDRADGTSEWVTKWDGADNSQVEAVKGGLSGAMKRAAVQWGVGRYLYEMPATWVRLDERGRFAEPPRIPREFLPRTGSSARPAESQRAESQRAESRPTERRGGGSRPSPSASGSPSGRPADASGGRPEGGGSARPVPRSGQRRIVRPASGGDGDARPAGLSS